MRKYSKLILVGGAIAALAVPSVASAAQPAHPGGFGTKRAYNIHTYFQAGGANDVAPGASEWGQMASDRAGTNGTINQEWRADNGFAPTHGAPIK
jgi:hypothetical protein